MISFADVGKVESDVIDWWRSEDNDADSRSSTPIALPVDEIHRYFLSFSGGCTHALFCKPAYNDSV